MINFTDPLPKTDESPALAVDACSAMSAQLAANVAKKQDGLISAAITERLGHSSWQLFAIAHRLRRVRYNDQPQETWLLDDKPLVEIWPVELKTVQEGNATKLVASVQHRSFSSQNASLRHERRTNYEKQKERRPLVVCGDCSASDF